MLIAVVEAFTYWGIIRLMERGSESPINGFMAFTFVFVPAILIWLAAFIAPPEMFIFVQIPMLSLYVIIPASILVKGLSFPLKKAIGYGFIALAVVFAIETGLLLATGGFAA